MYELDGLLVVGWIGLFVIEYYLVVVVLVLVEVHCCYGVCFEVISGGGLVDSRLVLFIKVFAWMEVCVYEYLVMWDVGLMLLVDGVYERAKCGYKLL